VATASAGSQKGNPTWTLCDRKHFLRKLSRKATVKNDEEWFLRETLFSAVVARVARVDVICIPLPKRLSSFCTLKCWMWMIGSPVKEMPAVVGWAQTSCVYSGRSACPMCVSRASETSRLRKETESRRAGEPVSRAVAAGQGDAGWQSLWRIFTQWNCRSKRRRNGTNDALDC
jgi:hypothetical protein